MRLSLMKSIPIIIRMAPPPKRLYHAVYQFPQRHPHTEVILIVQSDARADLHSDRFGICQASLQKWR